MLEQKVSPTITNLLNILALVFFLPFLLYATYHAMNLISRAAGSSANITVDTTRVVGTVNPSMFKAFAQGGEEKTNMLQPVYSDIRALQPKVIRIDHIFDGYDVVQRKGELMFDFSRLDSIVATIQATGATPLLSLSYMPKDIAIDGSIINAPNDWNEWALVVQKTVEHYSGRNEKNIAGVYYEVWNEPDHPQFGGWKTNGNKNYLTLYRYAQMGAEHATNVNDFLLGGPATTKLYKNWILNLIKEDLRVDFLSWHTYADDPSTFSGDGKAVVGWLKEYPQYAVIPRLITEFGFTGAKDPRYSLPYAAAFSLAVFRELTDTPVTYAFTFQLKDGPNGQNSDGWGILSHESEGTNKKPRYFIYPFLSTLAGNRVKVTGEGTWVTSLAVKNDKTIQVLLINFDPTGYHSECTPVAVSGLTQGTYTWSLSYLFTNLYKKEGFLSGKVTNTPETVGTEGIMAKTVCLSAQNAAILKIQAQ